MHMKRVSKDFEINNLDGVLNSFRNMCFKICELDPIPFLSAPGLA